MNNKNMLEVTINEKAYQGTSLHLWKMYSLKIAKGLLQFIPLQ